MALLLLKDSWSCYCFPRGSCSYGLTWHNLFDYLYTTAGLNLFIYLYTSTGLVCSECFRTSLNLQGYCTRCLEQWLSDNATYNENVSHMGFNHVNDS
jgi:hypothetical protein